VAIDRADVRGVRELFGAVSASELAADGRSAAVSNFVPSNV